MTDPLHLLGKHVDDDAVAIFLASHGGSHVVDELDEDPDVDRYVTSATSGVDLSLDARGFIKVVFLYLNGYDAKPEFQGRLPLGLSRGLTQPEVRRLLGVPAIERVAGIVHALVSMDQRTATIYLVISSKETPRTLSQKKCP